MIVRPAGCSDESSDDDLEYFGMNYASEPPPIKQMTEKEKQETLLQALQCAVIQGNEEETMRLLDEHKFSVDVQFSDGWTPLLLAASTGYAKLSKMLIDRGADMNQRIDSVTVLMHACNVSKCNSYYTNVFELVEYLLERKVDVNAIDVRRVTAIMYASQNGNIDVVKCLMPFVDKHQKDNQGWNILFFAVHGNHHRLTKYLLKEGLDYRKTDIRNNTVLDYARQRNYTNICDLIPNPESKRQSYNMCFWSTMEYNEEIANPRFMYDVNIMLRGMRSDKLLNAFNTDPNMNLQTFLTLTQNDLIEMNITMPYQQNRIMGGLFRFHREPYKKKSIPRIGRKRLLTTQNIGLLVFCALRHCIIMKSSLIYLQTNSKDWNVEETMKLLEELEAKVKKAQGLAENLHKKAIQWNKENVKVDLITWPEKRSKFSQCSLILSVATTFIICYCFKYRF